MSIRDMANKFGVAFTDSSRSLRVTIPNSMRFPHQTAWVWMKDRATICIQPHQPERNHGAAELTLFRSKTLPGCRSIVIPGPTRGIGDPFRMMSTSYRVDGLGFLVFLPSEEERLPPRKKRHLRPKVEHVVESHEFKAAPVAPLTYSVPKWDEPNGEVLVAIGARDFSFEVPQVELEILMEHWRRAGYATE